MSSLDWSWLISRMIEIFLGLGFRKNSFCQRNLDFQLLLSLFGEDFFVRFSIENLYISAQVLWKSVSNFSDFPDQSFEDFNGLDFMGIIINLAGNNCCSNILQFLDDILDCWNIEFGCKRNKNCDRVVVAKFISNLCQDFLSLTFLKQHCSSFLFENSCCQLLDHQSQGLDNSFRCLLSSIVSDFICLSCCSDLVLFGIQNLKLGL